MSQKIPYLHIDSSNRVRGTSSDFAIQLKPSMYNVKNARLKALSLPLTNYNISSLNNVIYISDGATDYQYSIPPGVYTTLNLPAIIKAGLDSVFPGVFTVSFDNVSLKFTISCTVTFSFTFGTNTTNTSSLLLGYDNVDTALSFTHIGNNSINLSIPSCMFLNIAEFPIMALSSNGYRGNFPIYVNTISGEIDLFFSNSGYDLESSSTVSVLNQLNISLINPLNGQVVDLNNVDFSFLLQLDY